MDVKLLEEISDKLKIDPMRPDGFGFSAAEFERMNRIGHNRAEELLNDLLGTGILECKYMRYKSGKGGVIYFKPGSWPPIK